MKITGYLKNRPIHACEVKWMNDYLNDIVPVSLIEAADGTLCRPPPAEVGDK